MILLQKEFDMDTAKMDKRFAAITSSNYDGIVKDGNSFIVLWKSTPTNSDLAAIELYWRGLTEQVYNTPTAEEQMEGLSKIIQKARTFGDATIAQFALENVAMGITQAGKTRAVADYCQKLQYYMSTGSLYAALEEIQEISVNIPPDLAPFVTQQRLAVYVNKIKAYLGIQ